MCNLSPFILNHSLWAHIRLKMDSINKNELQNSNYQYEEMQKALEELEKSLTLQGFSDLNREEISANYKNLKLKKVELTLMQLLKILFSQSKLTQNEEQILDNARLVNVYRYDSANYLNRIDTLENVLLNAKDEDKDTLFKAEDFLPLVNFLSWFTLCLSFRSLKVDNSLKKSL